MVFQLSHQLTIQESNILILLYLLIWGAFVFVPKLLNIYLRIIVASLALLLWAGNASLKSYSFNQELRGNNIFIGICSPYDTSVCLDEEFNILFESNTKERILYINSPHHDGTYSLIIRRTFPHIVLELKEGLY